MHQSHIKHRDHLGQTYKGVSLHAPIALHEYVYDLAQSLFNPAHPVLEIGAGSGALSLRMKDGGFSVVPVDLDGNDWRLEMPLTQADLNQDRWFEQALHGRRFKHIVAVEVIEHLENPSKFFRDMAEVLEDDGVLILTTPNIFSFHSVYAALKRGELAFFSPQDCISSGHISILPWWLLRHLAVREGLELVRSTSTCDLPMGPVRSQLVRFVTWVRSFIYRPAGFDSHEGLNVVMVFTKPSQKISKNQL